MRFFWKAVLLALAAGCGESTPPSENIPVPPLEAIPYELLGTGKIAFERIADRYHGVYLIDPVAQTTTVIGSGVFNGPSLSPDGEELAIAAYSNESGSADIFVHNTDGTARRRVSGFFGDEGVPTWTPDGQGLTFLRTQESTFDRVASEVRATDGGVQRTITLRRPDACSQSYLGDIETRVEVASNGLIATPCSLTQLVILSSGGARLATYSSPFGSLIIGFSWSPDGSEIAIMELTGGPGGVPVSQSLRIMSADGGSTRTVFTAAFILEQNGRYPGADDSAICWLKGTDRLLVAILHEARRYSQLWVVNTDGTERTRITNASAVTDRSVTCAR